MAPLIVEADLKHLIGKLSIQGAKPLLICKNPRAFVPEPGNIPYICHMKIQLKNVRINDAFSEETICFKADVFVNSKKIAIAENEGRGGCTSIHPYPEMRSKLAELESYCKSLPKRVYDFGEFDCDLESVVEDLLNEKIAEKEQKKIDKLCLANIVYGIPGGASYSYIGFKGKPKLEDIKKTAAGQKAIENLLNKVKSQLGQGQVIFNKNI